MAFFIDYKGAIIRAETASDVRDLILLFAEPVLPRLLPAGAEPDPPTTSTAGSGRGRRRVARAARRRPRTGRRPRMGGGRA